MNAQEMRTVREMQDREIRRLRAYLEEIGERVTSEYVRQLVDEALNGDRLPDEGEGDPCFGPEPSDEEWHYIWVMKQREEIE